VDHLADDSEGAGLNGSLRYCLTQATDRDSITFDVTGTINLTGALPDLTHSVSLEGPGADLLSVQRDSGGDYRIFTVAEGAAVSINGLTIARGSADEGGGIFNAGTLSLFFDVFSGNITDSSFGVGGAIDNAPTGNLTVSFSTLVGNRAAQGGGIANVEGKMMLGHSTVMGNQAQESGGGVYNSGALTVRNTTLADNEGAGPSVLGGGVYNAGTLTLMNSTLVGNAADAGGGIYNQGTLNLGDAILAFNRAGPGPDLLGSFTSLGYNLVTDPSDAQGLVPTDLVNLDPLLGPLQDNGGPTWTYALLPGSPAIDAGDPSFTGPPNNDQRGEGYDRIVNGVVDIGAYEVQEGEGGGLAPGAIRVVQPAAGRGAAALLAPVAVSRQASNPSHSVTSIPAPTDGPAPQAAAEDRLPGKQSQKGSESAAPSPIHAPGAEAETWTLALVAGDWPLL
jgi:hypothetical protein